MHLIQHVPYKSYDNNKVSSITAVFLEKSIFGFPVNWSPVILYAIECEGH